MNRLGAGVVLAIEVRGVVGRKRLRAGIQVFDLNAPNRAFDRTLLVGLTFNRYDPKL